VTVPAIDGKCVGGGAELAMWLDRRRLIDSWKARSAFYLSSLVCFPVGDALPPARRTLIGPQSLARDHI
jgi:hypothetical protein